MACCSTPVAQADVMESVHSPRGCTNRTTTIGSSNSHASGMPVLAGRCHRTCISRPQACARHAVHSTRHPAKHHCRCRWTAVKQVDCVTTVMYAMGAQGHNRCCADAARQTAQPAAHSVGVSGTKLCTTLIQQTVTQWATWCCQHCSLVKKCTVCALTATWGVHVVGMPVLWTQVQSRGCSQLACRAQGSRPTKTVTSYNNNTGPSGICTVHEINNGTASLSTSCWALHSPNMPQYLLHCCASWQCSQTDKRTVGMCHKSRLLHLKTASTLMTP